MTIDHDNFLTAPAGDAAGSNAPYRRIPHNLEAEQALLGAVLVNNKAFERVSEFLRAEHFFDPVHGRIFAACHKLIERGQVADPLTLKAYFEQDGDLSQVQGGRYLAELAASVVTVVNAEHYGRLIHDLHLRRELIDIGEDMVNEAYRHDLDVSANDQIEKAEKHLFDLATTGDVQGGFIKFEQSLASAITMAEAAFRRHSHVTGVTSGLIDLDRKLGGLHQSDLIILAGRPSMGKTALATNMAFNAAKSCLETRGKEGAVVGFFSLEMSAEQLATRILSDEAEIPSEKIRKGEMRRNDFPRLVEAANTLHQVPMFVDDSAGLNLTALRTRALRLKRQHNLGLIVIDYLQLMRPSANGRSENRVQEISEITRGLKIIAKDLEVPVLALSQLSRQVEQREDKRPQLSDLRESGSIEQDADVVMFVYREAYYEAKREPTQGTAEYAQWQEKMDRIHNLANVFVAKQRHGPTGTIDLHFEGAYTRFSNLEKRYTDD